MAIKQVRIARHVVLIRNSMLYLRDHRIFPIVWSRPKSGRFPKSQTAKLISHRIHLPSAAYSAFGNCSRTVSAKISAFGATVLFSLTAPFLAEVINFFSSLHLAVLLDGQAPEARRNHDARPHLPSPPSCPMPFLPTHTTPASR